MDSANLQRFVADFLDHVRGMWRYRWWANGIAWMLFFSGWIYIGFIPDVYRASTRVFVDTNSLLKPLMKNLTASENSLDQVQLVSKAMLTRPNLEAVAHTTGLSLRAKTPDDLEGLVTSLQQRVTIVGGRENIFTIQYEDTDHDKARDVVAALLDTFVQSSIGNEGADADVTENALSSEIQVHEQRLREAEERLAKFKQDNLGYMPGEYGDYYKRLEAATTSVSQTGEKVRLMTERRDALKRQIEGEEPVLGLVSSAAGAGGSACQESGQIQQLETQLAALRVQFTDKHPRVVSLQETLSRLQDACDAESRVRHDPVRPATTASGESLEANPVYQNLKIQLNSAEVDLAELRELLKTNQSHVAELHRDVDKTTEVEAQLKQLNRDYDVVQSRHQELIKRWEDLMATKRLDPVTGKVQFRRIEPPFVLADPVAPRRPMLLAGVLLVALAGGLVVAFALNELHPVYFTRASLGQATSLPVLGSVSMILTPGASARRRATAILWGGACLVLILCTVVAVVFASQTSALLRDFAARVGT